MIFGTHKLLNKSLNGFIREGNIISEKSYLLAIPLIANRGRRYPQCRAVVGGQEDILF